MKNGTAAVIIFLLLSGCATYQQDGAQIARLAERDSVLQDIDSEVSSGAITRLAGAKRRAAVAKEYEPEAYKLHALLDYRVMLLSRVEHGSLPEEEAEYLYSKKLAEYEAKRQSYIQQVQAQNEAIRRAAVARALINFGDTIRRVLTLPYY